MTQIDAMLRAKRPLIAGAMLRPFFEAYEIVADVLRGTPAEIGEKDLTTLALGVGGQYIAQDRVRSNESVSALLFATARQVVADQNLLEAGRRPRASGARRSCAELRGILGDMDKVEQFSREQFFARELVMRNGERPTARSDVGNAPYAGGMTTDRRRGRDPHQPGVAGPVGRRSAGRRRPPRRIAALSLADALTATGLPDPGPVTNYGLPFVRAAGEIAAVVAVGSFLFAAFLVPPQRNGVLDAAGYRALRMGTVASGVWTVCAAHAGPADRLRRHRPAADQPARPVGDLVGGRA